MASLEAMKTDLEALTRELRALETQYERTVDQANKLTLGNNISRYKTAIAELNEEINKLNTASLNNSVNISVNTGDAEQKINELNQKLDTTKTEMDSLNSDVTISVNTGETEQKLTEINQKLEQYRDIITGLESMNENIMGNIYDETEINQLINDMRTLVSELENIKKSSDLKAMTDGLSAIEKKFSDFAGSIEFTFKSARENLTGVLGILNDDTNPDGRLHSEGGDISEAFSFVRTFDMSKLTQFTGQLMKYRLIIEDVVKANKLLKEQKDLNTHFQTQDNKDLSLLLGKNVMSNEKTEMMSVLEGDLENAMMNLEYAETAQDKSDWEEEINRIKAELESLRKAKEEAVEEDGKLFDIENIKGFISLFNELYSSMVKLNNSRDMIEFITDPMNQDLTADQLKAQAIEYELIPDLSTTKAKDIGNLTELKTESQLLEEIKNKRDELNTKITSAGLDDAVSRLKVNTDNYTGEHEVERIKKAVDGYKALSDIKLEVGKASMEPTDQNLEAYSSNVAKAVIDTNKLREEVLNFKNNLATGNTDSLLGKDRSIETFKEKLAGITSILNDGLQLHLNDEAAIHDLELLGNTVKALGKELGSLSFNEGITSNLFKQKHDLSYTQVAYDKANEFTRNKQSYDDSYRNSQQRIADLTMESEKLKKALEFNVFSGSDKTDVTNYLKDIDSALQRNKDKVAELEKLYSNMGQKLPDVLSIKPSRSMDYLTELMDKAKQFRLNSTKSYITSDSSLKGDANKEERERQLNEAISKVNLSEDEKRERILGNIKEFYSSIIASAKRELEIQEALGNIKGPEDRIRVYNEYLNHTVRGTEEWAKITNLINQEQAKLQDSQVKSDQSLADEMANAKFSHVKNYVTNQEALTGQKMPLQEQLEYYQKAIQGFEYGSTEYLAILKLQRSVEQQILDQEVSARQKALDSELKQVEESINAQEELAKRRQKAYSDYTKQKSDKQVSDSTTLSNINKNFSSRETKLSGLDTTGLDKYTQRINILRNELNKALSVGDADRASAIWEAYVSATDKVIGKAKGVEIAQNKQKEAVKSLYEETKNYVSAQEALTGTKMSFSDQARYYEQQAAKMKQLAGENKEYIEIIKLKNQAEQKAADEVVAAAEKEKKAHEEALNTARQKVSQALNVIKSFASGVNNAVNKVVSIIRTGIRLVNRVISSASKIITTLGNGIKSLINIFGGLSNRVRGTSKDFNIFKNSATELRSKIQLLKGAFNTLFNNSMVTQAKKLLSSIYSINTIAGGNVTDDVIKWAQSYEYAFGLSARDLIADMQELNAVMYGLGMTAKESVLASQNLLLMGNYLAGIGFAGGDVDQVISKITSGMKGMTAAIDDLGLSVRDSQMNSFLENLKAQGGEYANISTDFSGLNEQARIYVRYASIIQQFTNKFDITNFAKSLDTVTGRVSLFKSAANNLKTVLGTGLLNVFAKLTTYLIPIINYITSLVSKLFSFFGISTELSNSMNGGEALSGVTDGLDETGDKLDEVAEKADKAKGSLQGFDRVNNVTTSSGSDSGENKDDNSIYKGLMTSMLDELNAMIEEATQSFADSLKDKALEGLKTAWDNFNKYAKETTGRLDFDLGFDFPAIKENLKTAFDNIKKLLSSWGTFFIEIGLKIADDVNIGTITTKITELLNKLTEVANTVSDILQPALNTFYEIGIKPIMEYLGIETIDVLDFLIEKLDELAKWFTDNEDNINSFFENLGKNTSQAFRVLTGQETLDDVVAMREVKTDENGNTIVDEAGEPELTPWAKFLTMLSEVDNKIKTVREAVTQLVDVLNGDGVSLDTLIAMNDDSAWGSILTILHSLRDILGDLLSKLGEFAVNEGLPWLQEKLSELADWISQNKDKIKDLLTTVAGIAWTGFKIFVDLVGKLIDFCVQNPGVVVGFFSSLLALKAGSWFVSTAAGLGHTVLGLSNLVTKVGEAGSIGSWFSGLGTSVTTAFSGLGTAIAGALPIIAIVVAVIVGLIAIITDLWNTSETFRNGVSTILSGIKDTFDRNFGRVKESFNELKDKFSELYNAYSDSGLKTFLEVVLLTALSSIILIIQTLISIISGVVTIVFDVVTRIISIVLNLKDMIAGTVDVIIGILTGDWDRVKSGWSTGLDGLVGLVENLIGTIGDLFGGLWDTVKDIWDNITGTGENLGVSVWETITSKTSAKSAKKVTTNKLGGSIAGGQIFIANENGKAELIGNIDGTGKTNVANNNMIIEAMTNGVFTGVYNALAEVNNQRSSVGGAGQNVNLRIDGFGLIDSSTVNELARLIAPALNSNNSNIANVNFTI